MKAKEEGENIFRFKQFSLFHTCSSMKVGVDGVLIGAWGAIEGSRGLDVGCGCGLIGMMAAQRHKDCTIEMIDIDLESIKEAKSNILRSDWNDRVSADVADIIDFTAQKNNHEKYDFIISNPPFFNSGLCVFKSAREKARHEGSLSPSNLITFAGLLLKPGGTLSMITTTEILNFADVSPSIKLSRICYVADRPGRTPKRIMTTFKKSAFDVCPQNLEVENLFIRDTDGEYSEPYRRLTKDFYLKF